MAKKILLGAIIGLIILAGILFFFSKAPESNENKLILYYSDTCPHCVKVEEYLKANKIEEKIAIVKKEVSKNPVNANDLATKAKTCNIQGNQISVPFLWDGQKCIIGDEPIIEFFKEKNK